MVRSGQDALRKGHPAQANVDFARAELLAPRADFVRAALAVIRSLEGRIEDRETWAEIHVRADELETALKAFSN